MSAQATGANVPHFLNKHLTAMLLAALLLITYAAYSQGLMGDFIFDDYRNIVNNIGVHLEQLTWSELSRTFSSGVTESLNRPISMLSFGLNHYFTGLQPYYFKLTNLLIHLLTCVITYALLCELLDATRKVEAGSRKLRLIALGITACWALHPLNVSTVLYIVQRMNQLATLLTLVALLYYCRIRVAGIGSPSQANGHLILSSVLLLAATLCKENGALIPLFAGLIEFFFYRFQAKNAAERYFLKFFFLGLLVLPGLLAVLYVVVNPGFLLDAYSLRSFTLVERVLTECRVLWMYVSWVLMPDTRQFTFYHDTFTVSNNLVSPLTTLPSLLGLVGGLALLAAFHRKLPILCFGVAWFLTGHLLESTVFGLELVFEHRNYLPSLGLLFGGIGALLTLPADKFSPRTGALLLAPYLLFLADGTYGEARKWNNAEVQLLQGYDQKPDSFRINYSLARFYLRYADLGERLFFFDLARDYYVNTDRLEPEAIRGLTGILLVDAQKPGSTPSIALIQEMRSRILNAELNEDFIIDISGLTDCRLTNQCRLSDAALLEFYRAIAQSTVASIGQKQAVFDYLAGTFARHAAAASALERNFMSTARSLDTPR